MPSFGHKVGMSQFHLRLPSELKSLLDQAVDNNGNSLNREIIDRLFKSFEPDPAMRLADIMRPHLDPLGEDADEAVRLIAGLLELAGRKKPLRKRR